jgi:hypothetical protein
MDRELRRLLTLESNRKILKDAKLREWSDPCALSPSLLQYAPQLKQCVLVTPMDVYRIDMHTGMRSVLKKPYHAQLTGFSDLREYALIVDPSIDIEFVSVYGDGGTAVLHDETVYVPMTPVTYLEDVRITCDHAWRPHKGRYAGRIFMKDTLGRKWLWGKHADPGPVTIHCRASDVIMPTDRLRGKMYGKPLHDLGPDDGAGLSYMVFEDWQNGTQKWILCDPE